MNVVAKSKELGRALGKVYRGIASRPPHPALSGVLLEVENTFLKLTTTDLEMGIVSYCPVEVREEGSIVLPGKVLYNLVRSLSSLELEIVSLPDYVAEIKGGKSYYQLSGFSSDDFPFFPPRSSEWCFSTAGIELKGALSKVYFTASKDESNPSLNGVLFCFKEGGKLELVASDDHRLGVCSIQISGEVEEEVIQCIVPLRGVTEVIRLLKEGEVNIIPGKGEISFQLEDTSLFSRLIEGEYPNYDRVVPRDFVTQVYIPRSEFEESLKRVTLVSPESPIVEISVGENKIELTSSSPEIGIAKEEVDVEVKGEEIRVFFNAQYLLEALRAFSEERVILGISGEFTPAKLWEVEDSLQHIIMPVEIKE